MKVTEAIRTKRAVRQYQDKPLSEEVATVILNAGRRAQSSKNTQPWHFIAIRDKATLQSLANMGRYAIHVADAALVVAILTPSPEQRLSIMFDAGQAASYMQLAAWELGVASCLVAIQDSEQAQELLGFPAELHLRLAITFGYALTPPQPAKRGGRQPIEEIVHWDKW